MTLFQIAECLLSFLLVSGFFMVIMGTPILVLEVIFSAIKRRREPKVILYFEPPNSREAAKRKYDRIMRGGD